jgi:small-conductance mechanosensitive channel
MTPSPISDCGLRIADCGLGALSGSSFRWHALEAAACTPPLIRNPQSAIRNLAGVMLADWNWQNSTAWLPFRGAGLLLTLGLLLACLFLLRREGRPFVQRLFLLLLASLVCLGLRLLLPRGSALETPLYGLALFLLFFCAGQGLFLLALRASGGPGASGLSSHAPTHLITFLAQGLIALLALLAALVAMGVSPATVLMTLTLVLLALSLTARETLSNVLAGLILWLDHPFQVGDRIQLDEGAGRGTTGTILEIGWRATRLLLSEGVEIVVPNHRVTRSAVRTFRKQAERGQGRIQVILAPDVRPTSAHEILRLAVERAPEVLADPAPLVFTRDFVERGVAYEVHFTTDRGEQLTRIEGGVRDAIWEALKEHGLSIAVARAPVLMPAGGQPPEDPEQAFRERRQALDAVDFLRALAPEELDELATKARRRLCAEGEEVIRQGEASDDCFIIHRGEVIVHVPGEDGALREVRVGPPNVIGEESMLTGKPRSATVTAGRDCELYVLSQDALTPLLEADPELLETMSGIVESRQEQRRRRAAGAS